ncbi:VHS-domain-containing protein [Hyphopichia burtonii NRRL Y-1933]|uniref:VHS-domain-containing protein n=1 Tax=Hyphopichia burtonii NRRL Y-1933 TaxID=984485 RepID=A0A1E4RDZ4_9ASCO|nr:VHS-domain-containing protein [Hyphopichia burtonii NRRL Y-1933]ODV65472.1 VHS-domain-containing protein [Hyphopichia burtonii NRRL Y-1933]
MSSSSSSGSFSLSKINPKLLRRIYRACRPTLNEPNLALNLEICDYVNAKQGSAPRDAAIAVAKLISQRDPQTSELAVSLLDNLVKNCGYPFHLQISRKEFLNELVKRFPERPPLRYNRVHRLILAQIEEWYQTICRTSKYKEDFGYIRDMHRLLSNKGYIFPEVKLEDAAVLNPSDNLKSLEDLQKEESIVHSAKLQELIRRGRPQDLQEANKLMKIMAGFKDDNLQENKKQINDDIARLKRKSEIFAEMLNSIQQSGTSIDDSNEALVELYSSIKSSQPIVTKIIEEDNDNEDYVHDLLGLNDSINQLVEKFQLLKNGQIDKAGAINVSTNNNSANDNLIDFDDDEGPISNDKRDDQGYQDLLSDLTNLSFSNNNAPNQSNNLDLNNLFGSGGSISLGQPIQQPKPQHQQPTQSLNFDLLSDFNSPSPQLQSNTSLDPFQLSFPNTTPSNVLQNNFESIKLINQSSNLKIEAGVNSNDASLVNGKILFSNLNPLQIQELKFMLAVPKSCKLNLKPQSNDSINGSSNQLVYQEFSIENNMNKQLKIKWKVEYKVNGENFEETGVNVL